MSKYYPYTRRPIRKRRPWDVHPIWRGIGCFLMLLMPVVSYAGAVLLVQANIKNGWMPIPRLLTRTIAIPMVGNAPHLFANILTAVFLLIAGYAMIIAIYSLIYTRIGPSPLGTMDAPPERRRRKRSK